MDNSTLHRLELLISHLLRLGVVVSGGCLLIGGVGMWTQGRDIGTGFSTYSPQSFFESVHWAIIMQDRFLLLALLGLVLLVLLPVVRVLLTGVLFAWQKEYRMALMAFAVFTVLVLSFSLGIEL